jgi:hypothetical protein
MLALLTTPASFAQSGPPQPQTSVAETRAAAIPAVAMGWNSGARGVTISGEKSLAFKGVSSAAPAFVRIIYRTDSKATVVARLTVNESQTTAVAFPPTGQEQRALTLRLNLGSHEYPNVLEFTAPLGEEITLSAIAVSSW